MNVEYRDGRTELLSGLNSDQVAEHTKRVTADPDFEHAEITKQMAYEMNGETNRHARRKWAATYGKGK